MEPAAAVAAYGVESILEGAAAAALIVKRPTMPIQGRWRRISTGKALPRSLHSVSVIRGKVYIFGGEEKPDEPVDSAVHIYSLPATTTGEADYTCVYDSPQGAPPPRLGHTAAVIADRIYVFGGRGGKNMHPLEEKGRVWVFDTVRRKWACLDSMSASYPEARFLHATTSTIHPLPSPAAQAGGAAAVAPHGTIFIQGGYSASGRLSDVWCFDVEASTWCQFPAAPDPPRGGTSLAFSQNRIYRYGGFDGQQELGGQMDYLRIAKSTFNDMGGKAEAAVIAETDKWEMIVAESTDPAPGPRSVAGLHPITTGQGRNYILCLMGEKHPSSMGAEGAGEFWDDVWAFQVQPTGMTGASLKDATRQLVGTKTAENSWAPVDVPEFSKTEGKAENPGPRGYFASAHDEDFDKMTVVLWGGVNANNERLGDGWIFTID